MKNLESKNNLSYRELQKRLLKIRQIIESVDNRCLAYEDDVGKFQEEVTDKELRQIYKLTKV